MATAKSPSNPAGSRKRQRRTADEARREILEATEKRLAESGPDGIRLQQIAADVGLSHPAILHHFGSREGLIRAVVARAIERLEADLIDKLTVAQTEDASAAEDLIEEVHEVFGRRGHARVLAWLLLSGHHIEPGSGRLQNVALAAHQRRLASRESDEPIDYEDTLFRALLIAFAMFGDAVAGQSIRANAGLDDDPEAPKRFRHWLARLMTTPGDVNTT